MLKKGMIIYTEDSEKYTLAERIEKFSNGESGWICVKKTDSDNISPYDRWRVTDRYLEMQIQRGKIKVES